MASQLDQDISINKFRAFEIRQPTNYNEMRQTNFRFVLNKCPHVDFFSTRCNIPGVSTNIPYQATPGFAQVPHVGDYLRWEDLQLTFIVDEDMKNWLELYQWLRGMTGPHSYKETRDFAQGYNNSINYGAFKSDATLIILNNNYVPNLNIYFEDCIPYQLSELPFAVPESVMTPLTATVMFKYLKYEIETTETSDDPLKDQKYIP